jgi:hypothetical protein
MKGRGRGLFCGAAVSKITWSGSEQRCLSIEAYTATHSKYESEPINSDI